jgi:tetratricopeptide (TPR) repeat protein
MDGVLPGRDRTCFAGGLALLVALALPFLARGRAGETNVTGLAEARQHLRQGRYEQAVALAQAAVQDADAGEGWHTLQLEALLTLGRHAEAVAATSNAIVHEPRSIRVLWLGREASANIGRADRARELLTELTQLVARRPWAYDEPADLVVLGRAALVLGGEPKGILDRAFEVARKAAPALRDPYLAIGELAIEKHDYALAAQTYTDGLKHLPDDPDLHAGLGRAYAGSERSEAVGALRKALELNPRHVPSLLDLADRALDAEDYDGAIRLLDRVRAVNPAHADAWAYRSAIAHLRNEPAAERDARAQALRLWPDNPRVDHLIGRKLSQNYRFAEGAERQRAALQFDPDYLPARAQLASDLLRLGQEEEGWQLAHAVHQRDAYDVAAFNLVTLHDTMARFITLTNADFVLRMSPREAAVYGPRAIELLGDAQRALAARYHADPHRPTVVEIFPDAKDFGVRTFGMPDNPGYLGVCFGPVVTANSPAAHPGRAVNWEAVLWHEFCHVVTLGLTRNRMPRWLSEGISVYEERRANPAWGERMTPRYREMILEGELKPVASLSAAFLDPESSLHLQFAYFQASLVVEFLVERFGLEALKAVLRALRDGAFINEALARHCAPLDTLERDFAAYARGQADRLAPQLDWRQPDLDLLQPGAENRLADWNRTHPDSYWGLRQRAERAVRDRAWTQAREPLERLVALYPDQTGADSAYALLARVHRELGDAAGEREALRQLARRDGEATDAYLRLMEIDAEAQDWAGVTREARRCLAVNPLLPQPHRLLARAAESTGDLPGAIGSHQILLELDPANPADIHFQLARLLHKTGNPAARPHLLRTLEDAPRHRAALALLLELGPTPTPTAPPATPPLRP